jgi:hypothetical protein
MGQRNLELVTKRLSSQSGMKTLSDLMVEVENGYNQYKESLDELYEGNLIKRSVFVCFETNADQMFEDAKKLATQAKKSEIDFEINVAIGYMEALIECFNKPLVPVKE